MRSILIHADLTETMSSRTQNALEIGRYFGSHLHFVISSPYQQFIATDPFGGVYLAQEQLAQAQIKDAELEQSLESVLSENEVPWNITIADGTALSSLAQIASLSDLVIVSLGARDKKGRADWTLAADLAMTVPVPVLAMPSDGNIVDLEGSVMIAWNGSPQAARALRGAVPLMKQSHNIVIVQVGPDEEGLPAEEALKYLSRHNIHAELRLLDAEKGNDADLLMAAANDISAKLIVMGVFGRSILRETLFGGVTKKLLEWGSTPLLLAH